MYTQTHKQQLQISYYHQQFYNYLRDYTYIHYSSRCLESPMHLQQRPRSAKSVEDMLVVVDPRRISAMSTTSGCSDCTTATLQGARSFGSSYFEDETAATPRLMLESDDDTSLSSNEDDFSSNHSQVQLVWQISVLI